MARGNIRAVLRFGDERVVWEFDNTRSLHSTAREDRFAANGVIENLSSKGFIFGEKREVASSTVEFCDDVMLLDEETAVDRAVFASNSELRRHDGLDADFGEHVFIWVAGGDEDNLIFAQLGLVALVSHRPVLEGTVALTFAIFFV